MGFSDGSDGKDGSDGLQCGRPGFDPWFGKIPPKSRAWQPSLIFLPGESPWIKEPGGLQSLRSPRVRHDQATKHTHTYCKTLTAILGKALKRILRKVTEFFSHQMSRCREVGCLVLLHTESFSFTFLNAFQSC